MFCILFISGKAGRRGLGYRNRRPLQIAAFLTVFAVLIGIVIGSLR